MADETDGLFNIPSVKYFLGCIAQFQTYGSKQRIALQSDWVSCHRLYNCSDSQIKRLRNCIENKRYGA